MVKPVTYDVPVSLRQGEQVGEWFRINRRSDHIQRIDMVYPQRRGEVAYLIYTLTDRDTALLLKLTFG